MHTHVYTDIHKYIHYPILSINVVPLITYLLSFDMLYVGRASSERNEDEQCICVNRKLLSNYDQPVSNH